MSAILHPHNYFLQLLALAMQIPAGQFQFQVTMNRGMGIVPILDLCPNPGSGGFSIIVEDFQSFQEEFQSFKCFKFQRDEISLTKFAHPVPMGLEFPIADCIIAIAFHKNETSFQHFSQKILQSQTGKATILFLPEFYLHLSELSMIFLGSRLSLDSNIYVALNDSTIYEVYKIKNKMIIQEVILGKTVHLEPLASRRSDFHQEIVIGGIGFVAQQSATNLAWNKVERLSNGKLELKGGAMAFWTWDLEKMLNFKLELIESDGNLNPSNHTSGTHVLLENGRMDVFLQSVGVVENRGKYIKFLHPNTNYYIYTYFRQPPSTSIRNIITTPFKTGAWLGLIVTWILIISVVKVEFACRKTFKRLKYSSELDGDEHFINTLIIWAIGANCQKASHVIPSSNFLKMVLFVGALSGVMIFTAYCAQIISALAVALNTVKGFADLVAYNFLFAVYHRSDPMKELLQYMIDSHHIPQEIATLNGSEVETILNTRLAYISYRDLFYRSAKVQGYEEVFLCKMISEVKVSEFRSKSAFLVKRGSEFAEFLNHRLIQIQERGFTRRYQSMYDRGSVFACPTSTSHSRRRGENDHIELIDIATAFIVVLVGGIFANVILIFEKLVSRNK